MKLWKRFSLKHSLINQYVVILLAAIAILPISMLIAIVVLYSIAPSSPADDRLRNGVELEKMWRREAKAIDQADEQTVREKFEAIRAIYPEADMYWIDAQGNARVRIPEDLAIPERWSVSDTVEFMKSRYDGDPFTTVAFLGNDPAQGFIVFQIARSRLERSDNYGPSTITILAGAGFILILFLTLSWIFFYRIRKRLLKLQKAMTSPDDTGIPNRIPVVNNDEIGQLETAFNDMVNQLLESRQREREEEELRRQLISNLSHDLRTPMTTIRGHAFRLKREPLSDEGKQSLQIIDQKIVYLDQLIDNLFSYSLLSAGKHPYRPQKVDIVRLIRSSIAAWYPLFEAENYAIEIDFPEEEPVYWQIDPQWMERILDNLFQNAIRHAKDGKYIGVSVRKGADGQQAIVIEDRGPGMKSASPNKGAGIGLSIVSLMIKEMNLAWDIQALEKGTRFTIKPN